MKLRGRVVKLGEAEGPALVSKQPISFLGGVDPTTGEVVELSHELRGKSISGRVLVFPHGKGSTVGSYVLYQLAKNRLAPAAILNRQAEPVVAVGAIIAGIPMVHQLDQDPVEVIQTGDWVKVKGGLVEVKRVEASG